MKFVFVIFFISHFVFAQLPSYWQLTEEQGLPSPTVYYIFQDSKSYIWFATESGLCRYDGKQFKLYKPLTSKATAVSNLMEDSQGNLWFQNFSGQLFYIRKDSIFEYKINKPPQAEFYTYIMDSKDNLYLYFSNQEWYKAEEGNIKFLFKGYDHLAELPNGKLAFFDKDARLRLYDNKQILSYQLPLNLKVGYNYRHLWGNKSILIERARDEVFYIDTLRKPHIFPAKDFDFYQKNKLEINDVRSDREGNVWFITSSGLYGYDKQLRPIYTNAEGATIPLLEGKAISFILLDKEDNYWISTLTEGVFVVPNKHVLVFDEKLPAMEGRYIFKLTKDNQKKLFLGMNNGKVQVFSTNLQAIIKSLQTSCNKDIEALYWDNYNKHLLVGCGDTHIFTFLDGSYEKRIIGASPKYYAISKDFIYTAGPIGVCFSTKSTKWRKDSLNKQYFDIQNADYLCYNKIMKRARCVFVDNRMIWLGYADGLYYSDISENNLRIVKNDTSAIYAKCFAKYKDILLVGTLTQGLLFIQKGKVIRQISTFQRLPSNLCNALYVQEEDIWVGTDKGLARINMQSDVIEIFNRQDGLPSEQINDLVVVEENVWLATPKGLVKLPIHTNSKNAIPPQIYIDKFWIWENIVPLQSEFTLDHQDNNIRIDFLGITYKGRGNFSYKYRLVGIDEKWIFTSSSNNFARYPSLPAGKYEFQVKAINEDGIESEATAILQITILAPIWQKWWFWLLMMFLFVLILGLLAFWRFKVLEKRNQIEKELRESQLASLKVQMNPHFIFNALNSIQEFILLNEKKLANQYLGKFADLMRLTLDMSNEASIPIQEEIKMLELYLELESLRFENLKYEICIDEQIEQSSITIPAMLIQPYIENSLKHGLLHKKGDRIIRVCFELQGTYLQCIIEDNGIGRVKSAELQKYNFKKHKSFAISATRKRLELLNYGSKNIIKSDIIDLYDTNGNALGTKVILSIPVQKN